MAEITEKPLDNFQIETLAENMALRFNQFSILKTKGNCTILLYLYQEQIIKQQNQDWTGLHASRISKEANIRPGSVYRNVRQLETLGLIEGRHILSISTKDVFYQLTTQGRLIIEEVLNKSKDLLLSISIESISENFSRIAPNLDRHVILSGVLAYIDNFNFFHDYYPPSLMNIVSELGLYPNAIMDALKDYILFEGEIPKKDQTPFFKIRVGKPVSRRFAFNCNDNIICNFGCRMCHRTPIELTPLGKEMCKSLSTKPQEMNYKIRKVSYRRFMVFSIFITSFFGIIAVFSGVPFWDFLLFLIVYYFLNWFTLQYLEGWSHQLRFFED